MEIYPHEQVHKEYPHEKCPKEFRNIWTKREHSRNRYYRPLHGKGRAYLRVVCVTKAQAHAIDLIEYSEGYLDNGYISVEDALALGIRESSILALVKKDVFKYVDGRLFPNET